VFGLLPSDSFLAVYRRDQHLQFYTSNRFTNSFIYTDTTVTTRLLTKISKLELANVTD